MLAFLITWIVLILVFCALFSSAAEGQNALPSAVVIVFLIVGAFWYFGDDASNVLQVAMKGGVTLVHADVW